MADLGAIGTLDVPPAYSGHIAMSGGFVQNGIGVLNIARGYPGGNISQSGGQYFRCVVTDGMSGVRDPLLALDFRGFAGIALLLRTSKDDTIGNPAPPSQIQKRYGTYRVLVPVVIGSRTISIDVKLVSPDPNNSAPPSTPLPRLIVKANHEVGLLQDVVVNAISTYDWQTLSAAFTATSLGVVEVLREKRCMREDDAVYWDNLVVS